MKRVLIFIGLKLWEIGRAILYLGGALCLGLLILSPGLLAGIFLNNFPLYYVLWLAVIILFTILLNEHQHGDITYWLADNWEKAGEIADGRRK